MPWRPHPKRTVLDIEDPDPWATSDRNGMIGNHSRMRFQFQVAGNALIDTGILVHRDEYDTPAEFLQTLILPPDPDPLLNARPETYTIDETDWFTTGVRGGGGDIIEAQDGDLLVTEPSATEAETENTN